MHSPSGHCGSGSRCGYLLSYNNYLAVDMASQSVWYEQEAISSSMLSHCLIYIPQFIDGKCHL